MPPETYTLLQVEAPDVPPSELQAAVRWGIKDIIDFHIDDAVIDVFQIPQQASQEGIRMLYAVAARATEIQRQVDMLYEAGVTIQAIDINELALRNIVMQMKRNIQGIVVISFTRTSGLISLLHQGDLYLNRNIQIGCDQLREAYNSDKNPVAPSSSGRSLDDLLDRQMDIDPEELRNAYDPDATGSALVGPALAGLLDNIALELQYSLDYYESHFAASSMEQVVIAPLEQEIPGMREYLAKEFRLPLTFMDFCEFLECTDIIPFDVQARCTATVGVALRQEGMKA
jgi:MSHA biogenesis protein MshI